MQKETRLVHLFYHKNQLVNKVGQKDFGTQAMKCAGEQQEVLPDPHHQRRPGGWRRGAAGGERLHLALHGNKPYPYLRLLAVRWNS